MDTQHHQLRAVGVTLTQMTLIKPPTSGKPPLGFVAEKETAIRTSHCRIAQQQTAESLTIQRVPEAKPRSTACTLISSSLMTRNRLLHLSNWAQRSSFPQKVLATWVCEQRSWPTLMAASSVWSAGASTPTFPRTRQLYFSRVRICRNTSNGCYVSLAVSTLRNIPVNTITGEETTLGAIDAEVLLVVNVASKCGQTYQYESLELSNSLTETVVSRYVAFLR